MSKDRAANAGFTLIEVLVALTILGVALAVFLNVFSTSLLRAGVTQSETTALGLAQSLLAEAGVEMPLRDGEQGGVLPSGFRWRLGIAPYGTDADRDAWPLTAKRVTARVFWNDGGAERSVDLTTIRLAPERRVP
jgi:general secretion pathway protein I